RDLLCLFTRQGRHAHRELSARDKSRLQRRSWAGLDLRRALSRGILDCCLDLKAITMTDDSLKLFEADGAPPLPSTAEQGYVDHDGAAIWYASFGAGSPVILLHGGLGHSGNWGHQVPALVAAGHRVIVVDSRGHGRSTRDARPFRYELTAS